MTGAVVTENTNTPMANANVRHTIRSSRNSVSRGGRLRESPERAVFRLLADIALRALSPAVNDPATAVQVLDTIESLLPAPIRTNRYHRSYPMGWTIHGPTICHPRSHFMILKRP
jgi:uncharacterized membrane protein